MNRRLRPSRHARGAFTLLEMIISIGLIVLLMSMLFWFYSNTLEGRATGVARSRNVQLARVVLDRMVQEVRQGVSGMTGFNAVGILGERHGYEVNTLTLPDRELSELRGVRAKKLPGQFDLRKVRYYIAWDEENVDTNGDPVALGLVRREERTYLRDVVFEDDEAEEAAAADGDAALAVKEELYAPEIKFLEMYYFDGNRWWDEWQLTQGNSLPQIVRITIGFIPVLPDEMEDEEGMDDPFLANDPEQIEPLPADRYSVFVRMPQADVFFGSRLSKEASMLGSDDGLGM